MLPTLPFRPARGSFSPHAFARVPIGGSRQAGAEEANLKAGFGIRTPVPGGIERSNQMRREESRFSVVLSRALLND